MRAHSNRRRPQVAAAAAMGRLCVAAAFSGLLAASATGGDEPSAGAESGVGAGRGGDLPAQLCDAGHRCIVRPPAVPPSNASPNHVPCGHGLSDPAGPGPRLDKVPPNCSRCSCVRGNPLVELCVFPTVPRSGNTWMRKMLETASGLPTATVFPAEHLHRHDDSAVHEDKHARVVFNPRSGLYVPPCGVANECDVVSMRNTSVLIAKSHAPFLLENTRRDEYGGVADVGIGASVVMAVRNPLDNYHAWARYLEIKHREANTGTFREYLEKWRRHMTYWKRNAERHGVPTLVYRYEDLFDDNCRVSVVRGALQLSGLYDELAVSEATIQSARSFAPTRELESALVRYRNKNESAYAASADDVAAAMAEPHVAEFGYVGLFRSWLDTKRHGDGHSRAFLDPITTQGSRCFLYWGV